VIRVEGDDHEPRAFSTWCAKSIALIGNLPPTLRSRAIVIQMKRKTAKDRVEDFHGHYPYPELEALKRQTWRWTRDNLKAIREAEPSIPGELINRAKDNWSPLFAVAQVAGGEWVKKCRDAALAFQMNRPDETSVGVILLSDLQEMFRDSEGEPLSTEEVLKSLAAMDERPWPEWKRGKPITARQLAKLLKPFGITARNVRFGDKILKGYELSDCEDAFARYIASNPLHPLQDNENNNLGPLSDPLQTDNVADRKSDLSTGKQSDVADVADWRPGGEAMGTAVTEYIDGGGKTQNADNVEDAWAKIRAEHEAKRVKR